MAANGTCKRACLVGAAVNAVHEGEEAHDMEGRVEDSVRQDLRIPALLESVLRMVTTSIEACTG